MEYVRVGYLGFVAASIAVLAMNAVVGVCDPGYRRFWSDAGYQYVCASNADECLQDYQWEQARFRSLARDGGLFVKTGAPNLVGLFVLVVTLACIIPATMAKRVNGAGAFFFMALSFFLVFDWINSQIPKGIHCPNPAFPILRFYFCVSDDADIDCIPKRTNYFGEESNTAVGIIVVGTFLYGVCVFAEFVHDWYNGIQTETLTIVPAQTWVARHNEKLHRALLSASPTSDSDLEDLEG